MILEACIVPDNGLSVIMEKIFTYLSDERKSLEAKIAELKDSIDKIDATVSMLRHGSPTVQSLVKPSSKGPRAKSGSVKPSKTIKQMVTLILEDHPSGLEALEIIEKIKVRFNEDIMRTSLSPQLSRLKRDKKLRRDNFIWTLITEKPPVKTEGLQADLGEGWSSARLPIHSASGSTPVSSTPDSDTDKMPG